MLNVFKWITTGIICTFLALGTADKGFAQQAETLISGSVTHGGFGGPELKVSSVTGSPAIWVGGRGGWIINIDPNHAISIGGGGYGLVSDHRSTMVTSDGEDLYALSGYGGFILEYTNRSYKLAHVTISSLIGAGGVSLRDSGHEPVNVDENNPFFVFEPAVNLELNITSFFRIAAGAGYRFTSGISDFGFSDSDFSGFTGTITFKFGGF